MKQGLDHSDVDRILKRLDKIEQSLTAIREFLIRRQIVGGSDGLPTSQTSLVAGHKDEVAPFVSGFPTLDVSHLKGRCLGENRMHGTGLKLKGKIKKSRKYVKR